MLEPFRSLFSLRWSNQPVLTPIPAEIKRTFIPGSDTNPSQNLELLSCQPVKYISSSTSSCDGGLNASGDPRLTENPMILFLHGGFGSAAMYVDFMTYMANSYNAPTYALSMRGRGGSYSLSYLRLVFMTGLDELSSDVNRAVEYISTRPTSSAQSDTISIRPDHYQNDGRSSDNVNKFNRRRRRLIIVAHSSGGGLLQYALANRKIRNPVFGIVLLDAIPNFGNLSVYANWARHDPWFGVRMSLIHFNHVASPLSSDALVTAAFFGRRFVIEDDKLQSSGQRTNVCKFRELMAPYESLVWPLSMMKGWWSWFRGRGGMWLDPIDVLARLDWTTDKSREKVCVIVGSEDVLMDIPNQKRMVEQYRTAIDELIRTKKVDGSRLHQSVDTHTDGGVDDDHGVQVQTEQGVRFVVVEGAGHHVQNDIMWEKAAEQIRTFALNV